MTYSSNCLYCGVKFTALRPRECCRQTCSAKLRYQRLGTDWPQEAELWLEKKAGTMPLPNLTAAYNRVATKQGWTKRSQNAIKIKLNRLNLSRKCTEDNITRNELARVLRVSSDKVRVWTSNGLPYRKIARNQTAIKISDVRAFLLSNPSRAFGVSFDGLAWLIGEKDAETICDADHSRRGHRRPVINLDTGKVYPGIKAAARENYLSHGCISQAIKRGGLSGGYRWAYVDELEEQRYA
jgi:hypothetical protein